MTVRGANLATLRGMNARSVLDALLAERTLSRAEIARRTGMSKPTANHAIETLLDAGLVREAPRPDGELHYGALFFEPVLDLGQVLAVDIGSDCVRGALADLGGTVLARYDHPRSGQDVGTLLSAVSEVRERLARQVPDSREGTVEGTVGTEVAVAGIIDPVTQELLVSNEPELEGHPLVHGLRTVLPGPVHIDNDVNLAALGELWRGAGRECEDFAFLFVGSGAGAGLVLDGKLRRGHHGAAGEVDYPAQRAFAAGSPAADSLQQLIDTRFAGDAARRGSAEATPPPTTEQLFAEVKGGRALGLIREEARRIAATIARISLVVDVPLIVLGGGIGLNGDVLLDPVRSRLERLVPFPPRVQISQLGHAATLMGAVTVAARAAWPRLVSARLEATGTP